METSNLIKMKVTAGNNAVAFIVIVMIMLQKWLVTINPQKKVQ